MSVFTTSFRTDNAKNSFVVALNFYEKIDHYYHLIISDDNNEIYITRDVNTGFWYSNQVDKFFNYTIKLLSFDGTQIDLIEEKSFDIKDHDFHILIKSNDNNDIQTWINYVEKIQLKMKTRFNIAINSNLIYNYRDSIEISREAYDNYLFYSNKPLTDDYSSETIIKTLFNFDQFES